MNEKYAWKFKNNKTKYSTQRETGPAMHILSLSLSLSLSL
jgi:hypothetical protein